MTGLRIQDRVLFFPVTAFDDQDRVATGPTRDHVAAGVEAGCGAVFAACGTGEFHALAVEEVEAVVRTSVRAADGRVPVLAGAGGPLGHARACAAAAGRAGAQALLVLPPYLVQGPQDGVLEYVRAVAGAGGLPVVVYHRGTAALTVDSVTRLLDDPRVVGLKDGVGDIALAQQHVLAVRRSGRDDVLLFNGLLTAELSQAAYTAIGVPLWSSAVFAMAPHVATAFHRAHRDGDLTTQDRLLDEFYSPLVRLRDETPGFAVALVKAGVRLGGLDVGGVRPPLVDPDEDQLARLEALLAHGRALVA